MTLELRLDMDMPSVVPTGNAEVESQRPTPAASRASTPLEKACSGNLPSPLVAAGKVPCSVHRQRGYLAGWSGQEPPAASVATQKRGGVDPTLLFGLERTFFSALNVACNYMMLAMGLLAITPQDPVPTLVGKIIYISALVHAFGSYGMHWWRLRALQQGEPVHVSNSLVWVGTLSFVGVAVALSEVYFAFEYPVFGRTQPVTVANTTTNG